MKLQIVVVRDRAADVFGQPFYVHTVGMAIRNFSDEINRADDKNPLYKHPADFDLYYLGEYDDAGATFDIGPPRQIAVGKDLTTASK